MGVARSHKVRNEFHSVERSRAVAKIIEFYIPDNFRKNTKWAPVQERGKLIEFSLVAKRSA